MVRGLVKDLQAREELFIQSFRRSVSSSIFKRSKSLWKALYNFLWMFSGLFVILAFAGVLDTSVYIIPMMVLYVIGDIRLDKAWNYIQQTHSRVTSVEKWKHYEVFRNLVETDNLAFLEIISDTEKIAKLANVAKYLKRGVTFDSKHLKPLVLKEDLGPRLRKNLIFLMSEESSTQRSREEIYVILFTLAEEEDVLGEIADELLSSPDDLQSIFK